MDRIARHVVTAVAALSLLACTALCAIGLEVHHPLPVACLLVLPIAWPTAWAFHHYRQRHVLLQRIANGQCLTCGYDLRATPGRCPECGALPQTPTA